MTARKAWVYMISGIGHATPVSIVTNAGQAVRIREVKTARLLQPAAAIVPFFLTGNVGHGDSAESLPTDGRYLIRFPRYRRDDENAQRIADAVDVTIRLLRGPTQSEHARAIRFPRALLDDAACVRRKDIVRFGLEQWDEGSGVPVIDSLLTDYVSMDVNIMSEAFRMLTVTLQSPYFEAVHYYRESIDDFYFHVPDIKRTLGDPSRCPPSQTERARVETAVWNACKAVEAIIGEPPSDEGKFQRKLREHGISPSEEVGYCLPGPNGNPNGVGTETVARKIRKMATCRDKRAAHGSRTTSRRTITYYELMEYQALSRECLITAVKHRLAVP